MPFSLVHCVTSKKVPASTVVSRWRKRHTVSDQFSAIVAASRERDND